MNLSFFGADVSHLAYGEWQPWMWHEEKKQEKPYFKTVFRVLTAIKDENIKQTTSVRFRISLTSWIMLQI